MEQVNKLHFLFMNSNAHHVHQEKRNYIGINKKQSEQENTEDWTMINSKQTTS